MTKEEHSVIGGNFEQGTAREIMETVVWNNTCDLVDDRDHWKAQCEARDKAIKGQGYGACDLCIHGIDKNDISLCGNRCCPGYNNWQFDFERFSKEQGDE